MAFASKMILDFGPCHVQASWSCFRQEPWGKRLFAPGAEGVHTDEGVVIFEGHPHKEKASCLRNIEESFRWILQRPFCFKAFEFSSQVLYGNLLWTGALALSKFFATCPAAPKVSGRSCLELGAGTGVVGLTLGQLGAFPVLLTDNEPELLQLMQRNIEASTSKAYALGLRPMAYSTACKLLCWTGSITRASCKRSPIFWWPQRLARKHNIIVCLDLTYTGSNRGVEVQHGLEVSTCWSPNCISWKPSFQRFAKLGQNGCNLEIPNNCIQMQSFRIFGRVWYIHFIHTLSCCEHSDS